ncbi:MAG: hypothetical protein RIK87_26770 [Fuerstiella sp.]
MPQEKNPILKRFEKLEAIWNEFAENPEARVLRWLADDDTVGMLARFVDWQNEEEGTIPDLFVRFTVPFRSESEYSAAVRQTIVDQYAATQEDLDAEGLDSGWQPPDAPDPVTAASVAAAFASLQQRYAEIMRNMVAVLVPDNAAEAGSGLQNWLTKLLSGDVPSEVRVMIVDYVAAPAFEQLAEKYPDKVVSVDPELDMPGAYEELVKEAPGSGPGHDFRQLYVQLTNAAGKGDLGGAKAAGERAVAIATQQQWPHLVTVAQMGLAAAYFSAGRLEETIACYRAANQAVAGSDDPGEQKLDVQTRMAEGSALIAAEKHAEAAEVFAQAVPLAQKIDDKTSLLECSRMAGWCYEVAGESDRAWDWGEKAVAAGAAMDESERETSTLGYAGQLLLRLANKGTHSGEEKRIRQQMEELLGREWEAELAGAAS